MKTSESLYCGDLLFNYINNNGPSLGLIVSKKYGNAVQRNLFKRRCRSVFRSIVVNRGAKFSIIVRPRSQNISYITIYNAFSTIYENISN